MLRTPIIHPEILSALARLGHGSIVLVTDAHYAVATSTNPRAVVVHTAIVPDVPLTPDVAGCLARTIAIESVTTMLAPTDELATVGRQIAGAVGDVPHDRVERDEFKALTRSEDLGLCVVTGDTRRFANALLRIGVTRLLPGPSGQRSERNGQREHELYGVSRSADSGAVQR